MGNSTVTCQGALATSTTRTRDNHSITRLIASGIGATRTPASRTTAATSSTKVAALTARANVAPTVTGSGAAVVSSVLRARIWVARCQRALVTSTTRTTDDHSITRLIATGIAATRTPASVTTA